ncbi:TRAP transporter large permease [Pacificibacter marinus]|uniref:TRAP transporter large permease protein n=1 Tax=Pacificibacter marinus TaxID=658057 RepID=A0A1Y5T6N4_9RHOB|nr:TRAP transporter large permease [Pacificibacter marinus]SEL22039.1 C4-dicarboxylate transporter, DctM subunit [Pacificibacter marinus]SLN56585.1 Sialic acid TRAP transporter permease protein SiaT [Pacificibacter marinus]
MEFLTNPSVVGFLVFIVLLLFNMPIFAALGLGALFVIVFMDAAPLSVVPYILGGSLDSFPLLATPLFIVAGAMITRTGISERIVNLAQIVLGSLPGGLALTTLATGAIISSMSGSNIATVAALSFLIPAMAKVGYPRPFAVAVVAAGCTFGVVIPPSLGMIIYGVITEQSIPKLFFAGIGPGLLMLMILGSCTFLISVKNGYRGVPVERTWAKFFEALKDAAWGLMAPVIVLGGIYTGLFTATEAAAVAVVYLFAIDRLVYRKIKMSDYPDMLCASGKTIGVVVMIIACSSVFAWIWQTQGLAAAVTQNLMDWSGGNSHVILLMINVLLIISGAFLEPVAAMYLLVPMVQPSLVAADVDLIHFGALMTVNLSMAHLTPPVGVGLFLAAKVGKVPFETAAKWALPFIACELVVILLVTFIPAIALFFAGYV